MKYLELGKQMLELARNELKHPSGEAGVRRAVSTTYYAVFHSITQHIMYSAFIREDIANQAARRVTHQEFVKKVGNMKANFPAFEKIFTLHKKREDADYDLSFDYDELELLSAIEIAENILADFEKLKTDDALVGKLTYSLLFPKEPEPKS